MITLAESKIEFDPKGILVSFPYNPEKVNLIKKAPGGRRFLEGLGVWSLALNPDNLLFLKQAGITSPEIENKLKEITSPLKENIYTINWGKVTPFQHQTRGVNLILSNPSVGLFWEQGLGKTLPSIKAIEFLKINGTIKSALIVCPKSCIFSWQKEFKTFSRITATPAIGKKKSLILKNADIVIINYDQLRMIENELAAKKFDLIVFDEMHYLKNHTSQRSESAYSMSRLAKYIVGLTGTPITNKSASDLFGIFRILDEGLFGKSFTGFKGKYYGRSGSAIKRNSLPELKAKIALKSERLKKEAVLDLPEKLYQVQTIELTPEQRRIYKDLEKNLYVEIQSSDLEAGGPETNLLINHLIVKMMKLNQICQGFLKTKNGILQIKNNKLKVLKDIVDNYEGQVVIFSTYTHIVKVLQKEFEASVISGQKTAEERRDAIAEFQDGNRKVIVIQTAAGAAGITLTAAHLCIYYNNSHSYELRAQSEDRTHRIGQKNNVIYIDIVCEGTVEELILESLEEKKQTAEMYFSKSTSVQLLNKFKKAYRA